MIDYLKLSRRFAKTNLALPICIESLLGMPGRFFRVRLKEVSNVGQIFL
ncbi:hypothetical protein ACQ9Y2_13095 [Pseudomonas palleroniana]